MQHWCDYFVLVVFLLAVNDDIELVETTGNKLPYPETMENIFNSSLGACYALVDPIPGPMIYQEDRHYYQSIEHLVLFFKKKYPSYDVCPNIGFHLFFLP